MTDLFGNLLAGTESNDAEDVYQAYADTRPWPEKMRLQAEKETLGLYLNGHPFDEYEKELRNMAPQPLVNLQAKKSEQLIAGLVVALRTMKSKRGDTIAFVTLDDRSARIEVAVFADTYEQCRDQLQKDALLVIEGEVSQDDYSGALKMRAKTVYGLEAARCHFARELVLDLMPSVSADIILQMQSLFRAPAEQGCPIVVRYNNGSARCRIRLGKKWRIAPSDDILTSLRDRFGEERVYLQYP